MVEPDTKAACQTTCYHYGMSPEAMTPPHDCPGLIQIGPVPGSAGGGSGYLIQVCRKRSERHRPARHIKPFPDVEAHTIVLYRDEAPSPHEVEELAAKLDADPSANRDIR